MYADDTIAAIATPLGHGGVGIVRVSGPRCAEIGAAVFSRSHAGDGWRSHHLYHGWIVDADGDILDEGLGVLMRAPRSYTGEDVLELHCHGSPIVLRRVLQRVLLSGARLAQRGEFTKRAYLNGRIDLAQAEAVHDLVAARTSTGAVLAAQQLSGRLSQQLGEVRHQLIHLKALLEAQIDFSEEDFDVPRDQVLAVLDRCATGIDRLADTYRHGKLVREGLRVAIVGKPNVGKSSLLNALLGEERAIVTPLAGTTRDTIDETADFDGLPVVLTDTAGLRESAQAAMIERLGMDRTVAKIADADLLLTVLDASQPLEAADRAVLETAKDLPRLIVLNKIDLGVAAEFAALNLDGEAVVQVSAKERSGLTELRRRVVDWARAGTFLETSAAVVTNIRHHDALAKARISLGLARQSLLEARPADLVAVDVQDALDQIGTITGTITTDDVLDKIFSEFCIGK